MPNVPKKQKKSGRLPGMDVYDKKKKHNLRSHAFVDSDMGAVIAEADSGKVVDANTAALRMLGKRTMLLRKTVCHSGLCNNENDYSDLRMSLRKYGHVHDEVVVKGRNGNYLDVDCSFTLFKDGGVEYILAVFRDISKYKLIARELAETSRRVKHILESISDGFIAIDSKWRYIYLNRQAAELSQSKPEKLIGKSLLKAHSGFKKTIFYKKYKEAWDTKKVVKFEKVYPFLNKWFSVSVYPSVDALSVYFTDITPQKESERQLLEIEGRYRLMIENAKGYALFMINKDGTIYTWSKGAERAFGWSQEEVIGKHVSMLYCHEDVRAGKAEKHLKLATQKGSNESEGWRVKKDGTKIWANEVTVAHRAIHGKLQGFARLTRDISERKATEEMLREQARELELAKDQVEREKAEDEALLDSIGEGVIATDGEGNITLMNSQAQSMLGVEMEDVIGKNFCDIWSVEDSLGNKIPAEKRCLSVVIKTGKKGHFTDFLYSSPHRRPFPVAVTAAPMILDGKVTGAISVFRDIRKEKDIDKAKSEFVSLASHQLRTPLTAIKLFIEMLESGGLGDLTKMQKEIMSNIGESNQKMIELVERLLSVSRLETGKIRFKPEEVDLKKYLSDIVLETAPIAKSKNCRIMLKLPRQKEVIVSTDPHMMRQVVINLITNAIDYSVSRTKGVRTVRVELEREGGDCCLKVENRGIGIPKECQSKIFERFYRATNAVKAKADGSGLGLYMSKLIVERLGGRIWLKSDEGKMTTFFVTLPDKQKTHHE